MWLLLGALAAHATAPDKYGAGVRSIGLGGGGVALVDDGHATRVNPAGLAAIRQPTASVGLTAAVESFAEYPHLWWDTNRDGTVDDRDAPLQMPSDVDNAYGLHLGAGRNVGGKFGIGASMYLPVNRLIRFQTFEPALPSYFMYENRPQRYVLALGLGGEIAPGLAIGAAVDVMAAAKVDVWMTADASVTGDPDGDEVEDSVGEIRVDVHEIDLDLVPVVAPVLGVRWDLGETAPGLDGWTLGASFRAGTGLPIEANLDLQANVSLEDFGDLEPFITAIVLDAGLSLFDHYSPPVGQAGLAWAATDALSVYADARWTGWSGMTVNVTRVHDADVASPLVSFDDAVVDGNELSVELSDVVGVRLGAELALPRKELDGPWKYVQLRLRAGGGYEPSPLVNQGTTSALLDADRTLFAGGAGIEFFDPLELVDAPVRIDVSGQYHALASGLLPRQSDEPAAGYPVDAPGIPIGGSIYVVGAQLGFDY